MIKKTVDLIDQCCKLLEEYRDILGNAINKGGQQDDPPAVMILRSLEFGIKTGQGMKLLIEANISNALLACTLCRAFFETSIWMLWASRTLPGIPDRWECIQKHWATEDLKWADEAKDFPELATHAEKIRSSRQEVLDRTDGKRKSFSILQMLRDIRKEDIPDEFRENNGINAEYHYTYIYRFLCRSAHGHPSVLDNNKSKSYLGFAHFGFIYAALWLLHAIFHVGANDIKAEINKVDQRVVEILNRVKKSE